MNTFEPTPRRAAAVLVSLSLVGAVSATFASSAAGNDVREEDGLAFAGRVHVSEPVHERTNGYGSVLVLAWPGEDVMAEQRVGESVVLTAVGTDTLGADGSFAVTAPNSFDPTRFSGGDGMVDYTVIVTGVTDEPFTFSTSLSAAPLTQLESPRTQTRPGVSNLSAVFIDVPLPSGERSGGDVEPTAIAESGFVDKASCSAILKESLGKRIVQVGEGYNPASGVKHTMTYLKGASTTLGVATSVNGKKGTFRSEGTVARSSSGKVTFAEAGAGARKQYKTYFTYGKYFVICTIPGVRPVTYDYYEIRPISFAGGAVSTNVTAVPTASYCVPHEAGSSFELTTSTAITWSNGASLKGVIGIDLSARSGFTTKVTTLYKFSKKGRMCGTHDFPGANPRRLVAKGK